MSRYFQTLKKLQQQRDEETRNTPAPPAAPTQETSAPLPKWEADPPEQVFPELPLAHREAAWDHMLESLRAQSQNIQPILVVAGVSDIESTRRLVSGLRRQAARKGVTVQVARLTQSQEGRLIRFLPETQGHSGSPWQAEDPPSVEGFDLSVAETDQKLASGSELLAPARTWWSSKLQES
jgi:hypothetical protein